MRPIRLTLQGFRSHQNRTEIDFDGRTLLAIVGPTGSGKSSILDGIAYALYGKTPRVAGSTSRLICSRCDSAEIELEFSVDGRTFTATRTVRRKGNSIHVLVDDAGEKTIGEAGMNARIEELVGLDFGAFCSSVLLPQGRFSEFLEAAPTKRMQILKGVFRFEQIDAMRDVAKARKSALDLSLAEVRGARDQIGEGIPDRLKEARAALGSSKERAGVLEKAMPKEKSFLADIDKGDDELEELSERVDELADALDDIPGLEEVEELAVLEKDLGARVAAAETALKAAKQTRTKALEAMEAAERKLGKPAVLHSALAKAEQRDVEVRSAAESAAEIKELGDMLKAAQKQAKEVAVAEKKAASAVEALRGERAALMESHAAHAVRGRLKAGEPCPVCEQPVKKVPAGKAPAAFSSLEAREAAAATVLEEARAASTVSASSVTTITTRIEGARATAEKLAGRVAALDGAIAAAVGEVKDPVAEIRRRVEALEALDATVAEAAKGSEEAADALEALTEERSGLDERREETLHALSHVASLLKQTRPKPNDPAAVLLAKAKELDGVAVKTMEALQKKVQTISTRKAKATKGLEDLRTSLDLDVDDPVEDAWKTAQAETATREAEVTHLSELIEKTKELDARMKTVQAEHDLYVQLENDLRDSNFVNFLLEEKRLLLSELGSVKLKELTGRYRFDDEGDFRIVDEFDGDKVRTVDTLSGGETFLASLALSLALAEAVTRHGGRLQCFFLDEGFGSLDPDSLDLALDGIERIVSPDRLIGLVSHVRGLADRIEDKIVLDKTDDGTSLISSGASL
jgi:exonuclease SbcC